MSIARGLLIGGSALTFGTLFGWPFLDKAVPCGFLDVTCSAGRFLLFWVFVLLGVLIIVAGLVALLKSPREAGDVFMAGGRAGLAAGRRGAGVARTYGTRYARAGVSRMRGR